MKKNFLKGIITVLFIGLILVLSISCRKDNIVEEETDILQYQYTNVKGEVITYFEQKLPTEIKIEMDQKDARYKYILETNSDISKNDYWAVYFKDHYNLEKNVSDTIDYSFYIVNGIKVDIYQNMISATNFFEIENSIVSYPVTDYMDVHHHLDENDLDYVIYDGMTVTEIEAFYVENGIEFKHLDENNFEIYLFSQRYKVSCIKDNTNHNLKVEYILI